MLDLSQFRGYRAADALTRAAPVGRTEFASLIVLFPCSNFVSSLRDGISRPFFMRPGPAYRPHLPRSSILRCSLKAASLAAPCAGAL